MMLETLFSLILRSPCGHKTICLTTIFLFIFRFSIMGFQHFQHSMRLQLFWNSYTIMCWIFFFKNGHLLYDWSIHIQGAQARSDTGDHKRELASWNIVLSWTGRLGRTMAPGQAKFFFELLLSQQKTVMTENFPRHNFWSGSYLVTVTENWCTRTSTVKVIVRIMFERVCWLWAREKQYLVQHTRMTS